MNQTKTKAANATVTNAAVANATETNTKVANATHFWAWKDIHVQNENETIERTLFLNGTIADESWFDDDITPALFRDELMSGDGDISVWINSPGGDCVAAAQIYNMLMEYKGNVTVKIDGIAASAASVIAMAGTKTLMSPVSMLMIHNPATIAMGDHNDMQKAIEMLNEVKESIINAYEIKSGISRNKIARMMEEETWMDARKAVELGFADGILERQQEAVPTTENSLFFSQRAVSNALMNKLINMQESEPMKDQQVDRLACDLYSRLDLLKKNM